MHTLVQDVRYSLRTMLKSPGFTVVALLTLALGIGANAALFSVVDAVLIRPMPFADPQQLFDMYGEPLPEGNEGLSYLDFKDIREQAHSFSAIAGLWESADTLSSDGDPVLLHGYATSPELFPMLQATPLMGRTYSAVDDRVGAEPVLVIGENLWRQRFHADPNIVGKQVTFSGKPTTIIGVLPASFKFPSVTSALDFWRPLVPAQAEHPYFQRRGAHTLFAATRLLPGVSSAQANAELLTISKRLQAQYPESDTRLAAFLVPMHEDYFGYLRPALLALLCAVGVLLLIGCANIANLLLSRAISRTREIAIRTSLGASRLRIVRQMFTESLLLAFMGGILALFVAVWINRMLLAFAPADIALTKSSVFSSGVVLFTGGIALLTGAIFGVVPALHTARTDVNASLRQGGKGASAGGQGNATRNVLAVFQLALCITLMIGAGLLIKTFSRLQQTDPGFAASNLLVGSMNLPRTKYADAQQQRDFFEQVLSKLQAMPGVQQASAVFTFPFSGAGRTLSFQIVGRPQTKAGESPSADVRVVSNGYFSTMQIPVTRGRDFSSTDVQSSPQVVIVNQAFANRYFPHEDSVGKHLRLDPGEVEVEIAGVVGNVRHEGLDSLPAPEYYRPLGQQAEPGMHIVLRGKGVPAQSLAPLLREAVKQADSSLALGRIDTAEAMMGRTLQGRRFNMLLLGSFASLGLVLAIVGTYGVIAYAVTQRTYEIGVRIALGAQRQEILSMILKQAARLAATGIVMGLVMARLSTTLLQSMLYGVRSMDATVYFAVVALLGAVALLASCVPAFKASRVDPIIALRYE